MPENEHGFYRQKPEYKGHSILARVSGISDIGVAMGLGGKLKRTTSYQSLYFSGPNSSRPDFNSPDCFA